MDFKEHLDKILFEASGSVFDQIAAVFMQLCDQDGLQYDVGSSDGLTGGIAIYGKRPENPADDWEDTFGGLPGFIIQTAKYDNWESVRVTIQPGTWRLTDSEHFYGTFTPGGCSEQFHKGETERIQQWAQNELNDMF